jgi:hypothetical protein
MGLVFEENLSCSRWHVHLKSEAVVLEAVASSAGWVQYSEVGGTSFKAVVTVASLSLF